MRSRGVIAAAAAAVTLATGFVAGCGAGGSGQTKTQDPTAVTTAAVTLTTPPGSLTETQPQVTIATTPTVPEQDLPGYKKPTVQLGDQNTPEQFLIGQLYQVALEAQGYAVALSRNIGESQVAQQALKDGSLDIYPGYLDQWNSQVAGLHTRFQTLSASYRAGASYARKHGFTLLPPTPFADSEGIAVLTQYAHQNNIHTIPQLAAGPGIIFGAPLGLKQGSVGLPALASAYGLHPAYVQTIDLGASYWWLDHGNVQAAYVFTTDPSLASPEFTLLGDPKHLFGWGNVVPVTTPKVIKVEGPAFAETIEKVDSILTTAAMRGLNSELENGNHSPTNIAEQFLQGAGIIPPVTYLPVPTTTTATTTTAAG